MPGMKAIFICLLLTLLVAGGTFGADDDDDYSHGGYHHRESAHGEYDPGGYERHRGYGRESHHEAEKGGLGPVSNPVYKDMCGACHFAYQPELLPAASWTKILAGLNDHFGEMAEIEDNVKREITGYLQANAADKSSAGMAVRIMRSLGNLTPQRITEVPYIQDKHMGIPKDFLHSRAVKALSNCIACHTTAEAGAYDEDHVRIPR